MTAIPPSTLVLAAAWLLAALSLWFPSPGKWPAWAPCLALASLAGLATGALLPAGAAAILLLAALCAGWRRTRPPMK